MIEFLYQKKKVGKWGVICLNEFRISFVSK